MHDLLRARHHFHDPKEQPHVVSAAPASISASVGTVEACVNQSGSVATGGEGVLRLTRATGTAASSLLYSATLSASEGMDISFSVRMWGGNGADGISFFLKDGNNATNTVGAVGGALAYGGSPGVPGALLGVGFDKFGNFSTGGVASGSCPASGPGFRPDWLVLRGPDTSMSQDGGSGYCFLSGVGVTYSTAAAQRVRIVVDTFTPGQPTTVSVYLASSASPTLVPASPTLTGTVTISASSFKFGFSGSTGGSTNNHDISGLQILPAGPRVTSIATSASTGSGTGPTSGGTLLTITGADMVQGATVTVGGQVCTNVVVTGSTQLTCLTPAGAVGAAQVIITNPNGGPGYGVFTYQNPVPTVTAANPATGRPEGGETITVTGTGFVSGATVTVGASPCTSVVVVSSTTLTCVTPAGVDNEVVNISVANPFTTPAGTGNALFTYRRPVVLPPQLPVLVTVPVPTTTMAPTTTVPPGTAPATTVPPSPVPSPVPADPSGALPELEPGEATVTENGVPTPVEIVVEDSTDLVLRGADFALRLAGNCADGCTVQTDEAGRQVIQLERNGQARVGGEGFQPGTPVYVWLFSEPTFLGEFTVAADGTFTGLVPLVGIEVGTHTLQVNGTSFDGLARTANLGVLVTDLAAPSPGAGDLPSTGRNPAHVVWLAVLLAAAGLVVLTARRPRRVSIR